MNPIQTVLDLAGGPVALTREINRRIDRPVTYQAVLKWARLGKLPRTEWTGETSYAKAMSAAVGGKVKVRELLQKSSRRASPDGEQSDVEAAAVQSGA